MAEINVKISGAKKSQKDLKSLEDGFDKFTKEVESALKTIKKLDDQLAGFQKKYKTSSSQDIFKKSRDSLKEYSTEIRAFNSVYNQYIGKIKAANASFKAAKELFGANSTEAKKLQKELKEYGLIVEYTKNKIREMAEESKKNRAMQGPLIEKENYIKTATHQLTQMYTPALKKVSDEERKRANVIKNLNSLYEKQTKIVKNQTITQKKFADSQTDVDRSLDKVFGTMKAGSQYLNDFEKGMEEVTREDKRFINTNKNKIKNLGLFSHALQAAQQQMIETGMSARKMTQQVKKAFGGLDKNSMKEMNNALKVYETKARTAETRTQKFTRRHQKLQQQVTKSSQKMGILNTKFGRYAVIMTSLASSIFVFQKIYFWISKLITPTLDAEKALGAFQQAIGATAEATIEVQKFATALERASGTKIADTLGQLQELMEAGMSAEAAMERVKYDTARAGAAFKGTISEAFQAASGALSNWRHRFIESWKGELKTIANLITKILTGRDVAKGETEIDVQIRKTRKNIAKLKTEMQNAAEAIYKRSGAAAGGRLEGLSTQDHEIIRTEGAREREKRISSLKEIIALEKELMLLEGKKLAEPYMGNQGEFGDDRQQIENEFLLNQENQKRWQTLIDTYANTTKKSVRELQKLLLDNTKTAENKNLELMQEHSKIKEAIAIEDLEKQKNADLKHFEIRNASAEMLLMVETHYNIRIAALQKKAADQRIAQAKRVADALIAEEKRATNGRLKELKNLVNFFETGLKQQAESSTKIWTDMIDFNKDPNMDYISTEDMEKRIKTSEKALKEYNELVKKLTEFRIDSEEHAYAKLDAIYEKEVGLLERYTKDTGEYLNQLIALNERYVAARDEIWKKSDDYKKQQKALKDYEKRMEKAADNMGRILSEAFNAAFKDGEYNIENLVQYFEQAWLRSIPQVLGNSISSLLQGKYSLSSLSLGSSSSSIMETPERGDGQDIYLSMNKLNRTMNDSSKVQVNASMEVVGALAALGSVLTKMLTKGEDTLWGSMLGGGLNMLGLGSQAYGGAKGAGLIGGGSAAGGGAAGGGAAGGGAAGGGAAGGGAGAGAGAGVGAAATFAFMFGAVLGGEAYLSRNKKRKAAVLTQLADMNREIDRLLSNSNKVEKQLEELSDKFRTYAEQLRRNKATDEQINNLMKREAELRKKILKEAAEERIEIMKDSIKYVMTLSGKASSAMQEIWNINQTFDAWRKSMEDAGASLKELQRLEKNRLLAIRAAMKNLIDDIMKQFDAANKQARFMMYQFQTGGTYSSFLMKELKGLMGGAGSMSFDELKELGPLMTEWFSAATAERQAEAQMWKQVTDTMNQLVDSIEKLIKSIKYSALNVALPTARLEEANLDYGTLKSKAFGPDATQKDITDFTGFAQTYLQEAQSRWKSSETYQKIYAEVMKDLRDLQDQVQEEDFLQKIYDTLKNDELKIDMSDLIVQFMAMQAWLKEALFKKMYEEDKARIMSIEWKIATKESDMMRFLMEFVGKYGWKGSLTLEFITQMAENFAGDFTARMNLLGFIVDENGWNSDAVMRLFADGSNFFTTAMTTKQLMSLLGFVRGKSGSWTSNAMLNLMGQLSDGGTTWQDIVDMMKKLGFDTTTKAGKDILYRLMLQYNGDKNIKDIGDLDKIQKLLKKMGIDPDIIKKIGLKWGDLKNMKPKQFQDFLKSLGMTGDQIRDFWLQFNLGNDPLADLARDGVKPSTELQKLIDDGAKPSDKLLEIYNNGIKLILPDNQRTAIAEAMGPSMLMQRIVNEGLVPSTTLQRALDEGLRPNNLMDDIFRDGLFMAPEYESAFIEGLTATGSLAEAIKHGINVNLGGFDSSPDHKGKHAGGLVSQNTPYLVGEKGPEMFIPSVSGGITPNNQLGNGLTVIVEIDGDRIPVEDIRALADEVRVKANRRPGNATRTLYR